MKVKEHYLDTREFFSLEEAHIDFLQRSVNELREENEKLRAALKPFADAAAYIIPGIDDSQTVSEWEFTAGELRAAEKLYYGSE